jgi:hypothetical protein
MVQTDVVPLVHVPPAVALERVAQDDSQVFIVPVIAAGVPFTVIVAMAMQPDGNE